jgi:hypothetical protein
MRALDYLALLTASFHTGLFGQTAGPWVSLKSGSFCAMHAHLLLNDKVLGKSYTDGSLTPQILSTRTAAASFLRSQTGSIWQISR